MPRLRFLVLALAVAGAPAFAHETIPAQWCPLGTQPVVIGEFTLTAQQLAAYEQAHAGEVEASTQCDPKTCGIVDEWYWAQSMAMDACGGLGLRGGSAAAEDAIPFVEQPSSFNHPRHHERYRYDQGTLSGQCVVCRAVPAVPPRIPER